MNKKIIVAILCIFIISTGISSAVQINIPSKINNKDIEEYLPLINSEKDKGKMGFWTHGPLRLIISKITLHNGSKIDLLKLKFILRRNILPRIIPILDVMIFDGSLDFTVEYRRNIVLGYLSPFFYGTSFGDSVNGSMTNRTEIFNIKHTVKVEGFTGSIFTLKRFLQMPPHFFIIGHCRKVTLLA